MRYTNKQRKAYAQAKLDFAAIGAITHFDLLVKQTYIECKKAAHKWYYDNAVHDADPHFVLNEIQAPRGSGGKKKWINDLADHRLDSKGLYFRRKKNLREMTRSEAVWAVREAEGAVHRFCPHINFKILFSLDDNTHPFLVSPQKNHFYHCIPIHPSWDNRGELIIRTYRHKDELVVGIKTHNSGQNFFFKRSGLFSGPASMFETLKPKTGRIKFNPIHSNEPIIGAEIVPFVEGK